MFDYLLLMMIWLSWGICIENFLIEEIKKENFKVFEVVKIYFSNMLVLKNYIINEDEWVYLVLYFMVVLEKERVMYKLYVLIICVIGYGSV